MPSLVAHRITVSKPFKENLLRMHTCSLWVDHGGFETHTLFYANAVHVSNCTCNPSMNTEHVIEYNIGARQFVLKGYKGKNCFCLALFKLFQSDMAEAISESGAFKW